MRYLRLLERLYPLYISIRFKVPPIPWLACFLAFVYFAEYTFMILDVDLPSTLFQGPKREFTIEKIQAVFYFLWWSFGTPDGHSDAILGFIFHAISTAIFVVGAVMSARRMWVPYGVLWYVRLYQGYLCPWVAFSYYFRLAYCIEFLGKSGGSAVEWTTFVFQVLSMIFVFVHIGLSSVFLDPIAFSVTCPFDVYDGKTQLFVVLCQFLSCGACHLYGMISNDVAQWLVAVLLFVACIIVFYFRIMITVHTSLLGQYVETAPLFSVPFVLLMKSFNVERWWRYLLVVLAVHVVVVLAVVLNRKAIVRESKAIFGIFMDREMEDGNEEEPPDFVVGNAMSILRVLAKETADPKIFDKFVSQGKFGNRASRMIEIVRFLGIFPSRRLAMLKVLVKLRSSSNYNRFTIYLFSKILRSLVKSSDEKHKCVLDEVQRNYIVHHHGYWKSRNSHSVFRAFREGCATCYFYMELKAEIQSLLKRFPFDAALYHRYADFLLNAKADYEGACKCVEISNALESNRSSMSDPFLHEAVRLNPLILKYCNEGESNMYTASSMTNTTVPPISAHDKRLPVAAFITESRRCIPLFPFICALLPAIAMCILVYSLLPYQHQLSTSAVEISDTAEDVLLNFSDTASALFYPFGLSYQGQVDFTVTEQDQCMKQYNLALSVIPEFFNYVPQIRQLAQYFLNTSTPYIINAASTHVDVCESLHQMQSYFEALPEELITVTNEQMTLLLNQTTSLEAALSKRHKFFSHIIWSFLIVMFFVLVMLLVLCIQLNQIMAGQTEAMAYLGSDKRSSLLLMERTEEAWESLTEFLSLPPGRAPRLSETAYSIGPMSTFESAQNSRDVVMTGNSKNGTSGKGGAGSYKLKRRSSASNGDESTSSSMSDLEQEDEELLTPAIYPAGTRVQLTWVATLVLMFGPSLISMVMMWFMYIPVTAWIHAATEQLDGCVALQKQVNASMDLLYMTYRNCMGANVTMQIAEADAVVKQYDNAVKGLYNEPRCRYLMGITCSAISSIVHQLVYESLDWQAKVFVAMPAIVDFNLYVIEHYLVTCVSDYVTSDVSDPIAFFVDVGVVIILSLYLGFRLHLLLLEGFNSLYHFPCSLLGKGQVRDQTVAQQSMDSLAFPAAVISVISSVDTGVIYSVSDNVETIINRTPIALIGAQLSEVFPLIEESENIREHVMPDHATKKYFRCCDSRKGMFQSTLMIAFVNHGLGRPIYTQGSLSDRLIDCIPPYFAKLFEESNTSKFEFDHALMIFIRFHADADRRQLEEFFSAINTTVMNYTSIKVIQAEGGMLVCSSIRRVNPLIGLAFVKDVLTGEQAVIHSVHLEYVEQYFATVNSEDEPYLSIELEDMPLWESMLFELEPKHVSLNPYFRCILRLDSSTVGGTEAQSQGKGMLVMDFSKFVSMASSLLS